MIGCSLRLVTNELMTCVSRRTSRDGSYDRGQSWEAANDDVSSAKVSPDQNTVPTCRSVGRQRVGTPALPRPLARPPARPGFECRSWQNSSSSIARISSWVPLHQDRSTRPRHHRYGVQTSCSSMPRSSSKSVLDDGHLNTRPCRPRNI